MASLAPWAARILPRSFASFSCVQALDDGPLAIAVCLALLPVVRRREGHVRFDERRRLLDDRLEHAGRGSGILTPRASTLAI